MPDKPWTRIEALIDKFDALTEDQRSNELELLTESGESTEVISFLRLNYSLQPDPKVITLGQKVADKYKLTEKIAAGGMGIVYRARQDLVGREVAVKMIHPALASAKMFARLKEEIAMMGRLEHPGIVRIFDADTHLFDQKGKHIAVFYTMELVDGPTMRVWMKKKDPTYEQKLDFFAQICDAVAFAHEKGVVHRDLKPENILVRHDLVPAVLDFGLSRVMSETVQMEGQDSNVSAQSPEMEMSGTPAYMSPERWAQSGDNHLGDLYALGVILYELICDKRPLEFDDCDSFEEMQIVALGWTYQGIPREKREGIDEPVLKIINSLLAQKPENRPQSASEVSGVIRHVLEKRRRNRRLKKQAPFAIGIAALVLFTLIWSVKTSDKMQRMETSRNNLSKAHNILRDRGADSPTRALELIPDAPGDRHSELEWRQLAVEAMNAWEIVHEKESIAHCSEILAMAEDGKRILGIHESGKMALFEDGEVMLLGEPDFEPSKIAIHPTRNEVALAHPDGKVFVFVQDEGLKKVLEDHSIHPESITFSPNGEYFAYATQPKETDHYTEDGASSQIIIYGTDHWNQKPIEFKNDDSLEYLPKINAQLKTITGLAFSPDTSVLATWSSVDSGIVMVWDAKEGNLKEVIFCGGPVLQAQWNGSGQDLLCMRQDGMAYVWENRSWTGYTRKAPLSDGVYLQNMDPSNFGSIGWLPDDAGFTWQDSLSTRVNIRQSGKYHTIPLNEGMTDQSMHWVDAIEGWVVFEGNQVNRWLFQTGTQRTVMASLTEKASFAFVPGTSLVALGDLHGVQFMDFKDYTPLNQYVLPFSGPVVAPNGSNELWFFTKWAGPVGFLLDFRTDSKTLHVEQHYKKDQGTAGIMAFHDGVNTLAASKGSELFVGSQIRIKEDEVNIETEDGQAGDIRYDFQTLTIGNDCQSISFSSDGRWLVGGSVIGSWVKLWLKDQDAWKPSVLRSRAGIPRFINQLPKQLIVAESDRIVLHDLDKNDSERSIPLGLDFITCIAECPVNPLLAIAHSQGVSIHSIDNGFSRLFLLPLSLEETDRVISVQFSPDGAKLVALVEMSSQSAIQIWNLEPIMDAMMQYQFESVDWKCGESDEQHTVDTVNLIRTIYNPYLK